MVRLKAWAMGPKGGRKLMASQVVPSSDCYKQSSRWERELNKGSKERYEVTIQDGNIRARV